ncbi:J domain-containing protein [Skermanella sp. TT6]|uniref:J domain-containing protein n=1 Tax=Skermanella cutis TaxID=2775420 RepID=A0ABX7B438_9PROT|nr:J domain-containing protein [Skermanella sp. TT6]QQP88894.1 J domain-containing protein [Skermanella sp. TT6]
MHKNRVQYSTRFSEEAPPATRCCDMPTCSAAGEYRAPKGRERLNEYFWFCLEHVREYNKAWDYYAGMSEREIERHVRSDVTWQRPTWPMGFWRTRERTMHEEAMRQYGFRDAGDGAGARGNGRNGHADGAANRMRTPEEEALADLDLEPPVDFARIKARYRELAKIHHPDINGGDKTAEETLKRINRAYSVLKTSYGA